MISQKNCRNNSNFEPVPHKDFSFLPRIFPPVFSVLIGLWLHLLHPLRRAGSKYCLVHYLTETLLKAFIPSHLPPDQYSLVLDGVQSAWSLLVYWCIMSKIAKWNIICLVSRIFFKAWGFGVWQLYGFGEGGMRSNWFVKCPMGSSALSCHATMQ